MCARQRKCSNTAHRKGILRKQRSNMSNEKCAKESRERFRGDISRLKVGSHTTKKTQTLVLHSAETMVCSHKQKRKV